MVENERRICMEQERKLGICTRPITQLWNKPEALEAADELLCGWIYEVLEEKDGFLRVRTHYGYESWMDAKEYLSIPEQYKDRKGLYMVSAHMVDVLAEPRVQGRRMSTLFAGSLVRISEKSRTEDDWIRVVLPNGREGWMRTHFLMPRRDGDGFLEDGRLPGVSEEAASVQMGRKENEEALRQEIADRALSFLGTQYRWGGKTAMGIDCSGMAFMSYLMSGILIYLNSEVTTKPLEKSGFYSSEAGNFGKRVSSKLSRLPFPRERSSFTYSTFSSTSRSISFFACAEGS